MVRSLEIYLRWVDRLDRSFARKLHRGKPFEPRRGSAVFFHLLVTTPVFVAWLVPPIIAGALLGERTSLGEQKTFFLALILTTVSILALAIWVGVIWMRLERRPKD